MTLETISLLENKRLKLQAGLDAKKSSSERNKWGQYATPAGLAMDILKLAKEFLSPNEKVSFFDPAIGTGSFYSALLKTFPKSRIVRAKGFEIDSHYGKSSLNLWKQNDIKIEIVDFTKQVFPKVEEKFNLMICNPPYVRHHHLHSEEKKRLKTLVQAVTGQRLSGLSGLYCYFLLLSHAWLEDGGLAGWLIPGEFLNVNYGLAIKRYLREKVTLLRIHRFNPEEVQFDDALVSSVVVWFKKTKPENKHRVEFAYGGSLLKPELCRDIALYNLDEKEKWISVAHQKIRKVDDELKLSDLFVTKRGLATGSNKFFILDENRVRELGLPRDSLKPILPSPRYVHENEIEADSEGNPLIEKRLFLLDTNLLEDEIKKKNPRLWNYLQEGYRQKVNEQYICKHRKPWYSQESRLPAPIICTYLGRESREGLPFRFILNHSQALVANVYLNLFPKPELEIQLKKHPALLREIWIFLNSLSPQVLLAQGRVYGGGLYKLEPKELGNVPIGQIVSKFPRIFKNKPKQRSLFAHSSGVQYF